MCADKVAATLKVVGLPFTFSFPSVLPGACLCLGLRLARTSLAPRVLPRAQSYPGKLDAISGPKATYPTDPTSPSHSARMAPEEFKHPGVGRLTRQPAAPHRHGAATPGSRRWTAALCAVLAFLIPAKELRGSHGAFQVTQATPERAGWTSLGALRLRSPASGTLRVRAHSRVSPSHQRRRGRSKFFT